MPRSILVALDASDQSEGAIELGLHWAKSHDALLVGLGVVDEPSIRSSEAVPLGAMSFKEQRDERLLEQARRQVELRLSAFAARCANAGVACKLLEDVGMPGEQIMLESQRFDLVMLGQKSEFRFWWTENGRTLHEVVRGSPRPIIAAPPRRPAPGPILVAYDGSLQAARTIQAFWGSGLHKEQKLHIVSVGSDRVEMAKCAGRAADYLGGHGVDVQTRVVASDEGAGKVILDVAKDLAAELIVMGAYGKPTLREFLFGTVTRTVLESSPVPLFLYH